jgi:DNA polymerase III epsilon subunit-like protein
MNNYINIYSNKRNIKCKVLVSNKINNKTIIIGEIDLIDNDTIVDFKCSESEFKLEWLLQLLFYYSLYEKERKKKDEITLETSSSSLKLEDPKKNKLKKIKKLKIINIMYGYEYTIDISELKYNYIDLINYIEYKIKCDQLNIRNFETLSFLYNLLDNKNNNIKQKEILDPIVFNKNNTNDYYMILDTETGELNEDIIQLSYLLVDKNNNIIKQVDKYVKNRLPSVKTIEIHNINTYYLRENGIEFYDIIKEFIDDLSKVSYIVGHNVNYDLRVIQNDIRKYELIILKNNKYNYDIFEEIQIIDTYHKTNKSLEKLYIELFDKPFDNAHNSLNDVIATYECYKKLFL